MTSVNHIVGGIAITGLSLSFWDINIFANASYLSTAVFASLLPDIDHTKSIIGKMFFPLARWLDKNYGHRTVTHSLSAFIPLVVIVMFMELNLINTMLDTFGTPYTLIFGFAFFSHLILDMLTVHGVPLFYPFLRNPCVIPANPSYRMRSGNMRSEAMALFLFTMIILSSFDLFQNGFWTTYNRSFGTIKHVDREFWNATNILDVQYSFDRYNEKVTGTGKLIEGSQNEIVLFTANSLLKISNQNPAIKNIDVQPSDSGAPYVVSSVTMQNVSIDSLNSFLNGKIFKGKIFANEPFLFNGKTTSDISIPNFMLNPVVQKIPKTTPIEVIKLRSKLVLLQNENAIVQDSIQRLKLQKIVWKNHLNGNDLYLKNKAQNEIQIIEKNIDLLSGKIQSTTVIKNEIKLLQISASFEVSGQLEVMNLP